MRLRFSGEIDPHRSIIELVPEKSDAVAMKPVFGPAPGDIALMLPRLEAGRYRLHYRILAADGHMTDGTLPIRVIPAE